MTVVPFFFSKGSFQKPLETSLATPLHYYKELKMSVHLALLEGKDRESL